MTPPPFLAKLSLTGTVRLGSYGEGPRQCLFLGSFGALQCRFYSHLPWGLLQPSS